MKRLLRGGRRALSDYLVRRLWQSLVAFGAAHDPFLHLAGDDEVPPRQRPGGPPPAHPERLREDVPLSAEELRILRELWPTSYAEQQAPDSR
ncbi:DUF6059 family protein (plasmid) [Streptomyces sp. FXJ1.172]|jgi:hypothetical protein|uniref:DUF6059 family protein n=1 Tax=Streptomyces sp. FXJ1.172 TaxID=710705 RepID=UPI0023DD2247|nr:DUF6059 family protein [Streptomyces sp. FXJ1.172]WEP00969.1 hypothetical protein A6P39_044760 [Streptomyces sp. FXJ1.172]